MQKHYVCNTIIMKVRGLVRRWAEGGLSKHLLLRNLEVHKREQKYDLTIISPGFENLTMYLKVLGLVYQVIDSFHLKKEITYK